MNIVGNNMQVKFRSNDDFLKMESWPLELCCKPEVGERIEAKSGRVGKIASITHCCDRDIAPFLLVELSR